MTPFSALSCCRAVPSVITLALDSTETPLASCWRRAVVHVERATCVPVAPWCQWSVPLESVVPQPPVQECPVVQGRTGIWITAQNVLLALSRHSLALVVVLWWPVCSTGGAADCSPCDAGRFGATPRLTVAVCTGPCAPGYYCPPDSTNATAARCPEGHVCEAGAGAPVPCAAGSFSADGAGQSLADVCQRL